MSGALHATTVFTVVLTIAGCAKAPPAVPAVRTRPDALQQLRADLATLINQSGHQRTTWGIAVQSLTEGDRLYEINPRALLIPASAMKLVTAAAAAAAVSWDYVFETTAEATGPVEDTVLHGDLVISGAGDPSLLGRGGTDYVSALIKALRDRSIAAIAGRIIGDDNLVEEPRPGLAWSWDDLGTPAGTVAGALNITENTVRIAIRPGPVEGAPTSVELPSDAPDFAIVNRSLTGAAQSALTVWAEQRPGETGLTLAGTIAADAMPARLTVAVGNPTLWFARVIRSRLIAAGIAVLGAAVDIDELTEPLPAGTPILVHRSPPLSAIVRPMLKESINLYAEAVLRLCTGRLGPRTTADAIAAAHGQLRTWGVSDEAIQIADGSGLSRHNVIAPDALVAVLKQLYDPKRTSPFMEALPLAGVDGTLAGRMKDTPAAGNAQAKTGSMTNVRSLAGYVTTRDGEPLAFVIIANNFEGAPAAVTATIDRIVVRLASFSRKEKSQTPMTKSQR